MEVKFDIDEQTLKDLEIYPESRFSPSIYSFFNKAKTLGGREGLRYIMRRPLNSYSKLTERRNTIKFFYDTGIRFIVDLNKLDIMETYLNMNVPVWKNNCIDSVYREVMYWMFPTNEHYIIKSGIRYWREFLKYLHEKLKDIDHTHLPGELKESIGYINKFLSRDEITPFIRKWKRLSIYKLAKLDKLLRNKFVDETKKILEIFYDFDAYISISEQAKKSKLVFPEYIDSQTPFVDISSFRHILLEDAVPYDIKIDRSSNVNFLTGPNMAGKSTFLKSVGLMVYLSHLGFPVPAKRMCTSIFNGIISTINLADNMNKGYSHFYSEVRRVKETAVKLQKNKSVFVIFDELFRGTNVKDAYDASLMVIKAFSRINTSAFYVSTHITEIADKIKCLDNVKFSYFDSKLINDEPVYNYKICDGISHERLGMLIVQRENIEQILESVSQ